ncbi:hypothetical protein DVH24_014415 [Malus domestica]|uniref:Uncharacterized protein n=1 Tax=Malus domestica TaxID=3750 RepID=A0A498KI50_MALDO|nr:hypothetical protein DVH24_014415 [Malus domestica]
MIKIPNFAFLCNSYMFGFLIQVEGLHGDSKVRGVNLGGILFLGFLLLLLLFERYRRGYELGCKGRDTTPRSACFGYVSAENGGGMNVSVNRDIASLWETFRGCSFSATREPPLTLGTLHIEKITRVEFTSEQ